MRSTTWERGGELEPEPSPLNLWGSTTFPLCRISARPSATSSRATRRVTSISGLQSRGRTLRGISEGQLLRRVSRRYRQRARGEQRSAWLWGLLLFFFFFFRGLTRSSTVPWRAGWTPSSPSTCLPRRLPPSHRPSAAPTPWPSDSRTLSNGSLTWHAKIEVKIFFTEQRSRASRSGVGGGCCPRERDHATDGFRVSAGRRVLQWAAAEAARATRRDAARR